MLRLALQHGFCISVWPTSNLSILSLNFSFGYYDGVWLIGYHKKDLNLFSFTEKLHANTLYFHINSALLVWDA